MAAQLISRPPRSKRWPAPPVPCREGRPYQGSEAYRGLYQGYLFFVVCYLGRMVSSMDYNKLELITMYQDEAWANLAP
jgi:hypothetical protein